MWLNEKKPIFVGDTWQETSLCTFEDCGNLKQLMFSEVSRIYRIYQYAWLGARNNSKIIPQLNSQKLRLLCNIFDSNISFVVVCSSLNSPTLSVDSPLSHAYVNISTMCNHSVSTCKGSIVLIPFYFIIKL